MVQGNKSAKNRGSFGWGVAGMTKRANLLAHGGIESRPQGTNYANRVTRAFRPAPPPPPGDDGDDDDEDPQERQRKRILDWETGFWSGYTNASEAAEMAQAHADNVINNVAASSFEEPPPTDPSTSEVGVAVFG